MSVNPQTSSRMLALAAAGVIIVVCGAVTAVLLLVQDVPSGDADSVASNFPFDVGTETYTEPDIYTETETFVEPETSTETDEYPTDETTARSLDGFQQVS